MATHFTPMKINRLLFACMVSMLALGLSSCASSVERRIQRNPEAFAKLTEADKGAVMAGKIREGMTKDTVLLSWGKPARISSGQRKGQTYERWSYVQYQSYVTQSYGWGGGIGWGGGWRGAGWGGGWGAPGCGVGYRGMDPFWGVGMGPMVDFVPYEAATVEFVGSKVVGWSMPQR
jgi:hypothetical protein